MMQRVKLILNAQGLTCWTDEGIKPGTPLWQDAIEQAIEECHCVVVLLSPHAKRSIWVKRELNYALAQQKPILALLVAGHDSNAVPLVLIGSQYVDVRTDFDAGIARLLPEVAEIVGVDLSSLTAAEPDPQPEPSSQIHITENLEARLKPGTERSGVAEQPPTPFLEEAEIDGPIEPVMHNADWEPVIRTINGIEMVLVPPGCFMMGSEDIANAQPVHQRCIHQPFWMGRYPITNLQYDDAVEAGACQRGFYADKRNFNRSQQPVVGISWYDAVEFAHWKQMRLPTETEWEYAARGPDGLVYPWGNTLIADNLVYGAKANWKTASVDNRPNGASWVEALDLSGNAGEWCLTQWQEPYVVPEINEINESEAFRVVRGGAFNLDFHLTRATARLGSNPFFDSGPFGLRLITLAPIINSGN